MTLTTIFLRSFISILTMSEFSKQISSNMNHNDDGNISDIYSPENKMFNAKFNHFMYRNSPPETRAKDNINLDIPTNYDTPTIPLSHTNEYIFKTLNNYKFDENKHTFKTLNNYAFDKNRHSSKTLNNYSFDENKDKNEFDINAYQFIPVKRRIHKTDNHNIYRSKITQGKNTLSLTEDSLKIQDELFRINTRRSCNILSSDNNKKSIEVSKSNPEITSHTFIKTRINIDNNGTNLQTRKPYQTSNLQINSSFLSSIINSNYSTKSDTNWRSAIKINLKGTYKNSKMKHNNATISNPTIHSKGDMNSLKGNNEEQSSFKLMANKFMNEHKTTNIIRNSLNNLKENTYYGIKNN